jgi:hypothetical protein
MLRPRHLAEHILDAQHTQNTKEQEGKKEMTMDKSTKDDRNEMKFRGILDSMPTVLNINSPDRQSETKLRER